MGVKSVDKDGNLSEIPEHQRIRRVPVTQDVEAGQGRTAKELRESAITVAVCMALAFVLGAAAMWLGHQTPQESKAIHIHPAQTNVEVAPARPAVTVTPAIPRVNVDNRLPEIQIHCPVPVVRDIRQEARVSSTVAPPKQTLTPAGNKKVGAGTIGVGSRRHDAHTAPAPATDRSKGDRPERDYAEFVPPPKDSPKHAEWVKKQAEKRRPNR
jgi:hypothetical protein